MKPRIVNLFLCLLIVSIFSSTAQAEDIDFLLQEAKQLGLSERRVWLKLLHFEFNDRDSVVLTDDFFLSPRGRENPEEELNATLRAYFTPWSEENTRHPRCVFPARYYWLSRHLPLPGYQLREERCQKLEQWALFDSVNSVSLLLVSGYLGNPASTFGHALLKLNTDSKDDSKGFFDLTINYGAVIPENEGALRYVFRGLFGGYEAGFSDRYYYTKDLVYSRREYRDIWDYRLQLTEYERTLLILHIWEIAGKKFTYYFLDRNCAFRLAELVDLVIEEDLFTRGGLWYLPVETFHRLKEIHGLRLRQGDQGLIESVRYIPSGQRELYAQIKHLSQRDIKTVNRILRTGVDSSAAHLKGSSVDEKVAVLDALLAYQQYRIESTGEEAAGALKKDKQTIMLERLSLPPKELKKSFIPPLDSPADGTRPMETAVAAAFDKEGDAYVRLSWSPFKKETAGKNSLESDELVVFDVALGILDGGDRVVLDQFDLIRILNLNLMALPLEGEDQWSWKLRVGSNRVGDNNDDAYDGVFSFGIGSAKELSRGMVGYVMADVAAHTLEPYARLRPHAGISLDWGKYKAHLYGGVETENYDFRIMEIWGGQMQYQMTDRSALKIEASNERAARYSAGLSYYW